MKAKDIIREIQKLPISKRMYIVERSMHLIRKQKEQEAMKKAADTLLPDYQTNNELTIFSALDADDFYEAR